LAVVTLGLVLRVAQIDTSLWIDELHTAWTAAGDAADVGPRARIGNNSPLYFYVAWATTQVLGMNEPVLRIPSVVAGTLLIPLVFVAALGWTNSRSAGLLAASLVAIDSHFLFYAQEARPYALVQLVGLFQVMAFWKSTQRPTPQNRVVWILLTSLVFHLHYTGLLLVTGELAYYFLAKTVLRRQFEYAGTQLLIDLVLTGLLCSPAVPHVLQVAARRNNWALFVPRSPPWTLLTIFPLSLYVAVPAAAALLVATVRKVRRQQPLLVGVRPAPLLLVCCWLFVPLAIAWLTTYTDIARIFFRRYVVALSAAPPILSAMIVALIPQRIPRIGAALVVLAVATGMIGPIRQWMHDGRFVRRGEEDWRAAVQWVNAEQPTPCLPVLVWPGLIEADALRAGNDPRMKAYCLLPVTGIYELKSCNGGIFPLPNSDAGRLTPGQRQRVVNQRGAWLVVRGGDKTGDAVMAQIVKHWGDWPPPKVACKRAFAGVAVLRFTLP
jgi:hypothetical protein